MLHVKNAPSVALLVALLPACSLLIDTKPDGVINEAGGMGTTLRGSSQAIRGGTAAIGGRKSAEPTNTLGGRSGTTAIGGSSSTGLANASGATGGSSTLPFAGATGQGGASTGSGTQGLCLFSEPMCIISGACYSDGEANPDNGCQVCNTTLSQSAWSNNDGKSCTDGRFCTVDDSCNAGACVGRSRVCDDGVACNGAEVCDDTKSQCTGVASICSADQICDVGTDTCKLTCAGCIIDGSCYAKGRSSSANSCLVCDPDKTSAAWSIAAGAGCDDGDLCTNNDRCDSAGRCEGTAVVCTDDAAVCGADRTCNPSTGLCAEQFPGNSVTCDDGDSCTANDRCNGTGRCIGAPSTGTGCECLSDSDCNDGLTCTTDTCSQGKCSSVVSTGCLIGGKCYANAAANPTNSCQRCDVSLSNKAWSNSPSTISCDDGLWCNGDQDFCDGQGSCSHAYPSSNRCAGTTGACEIKTCNESKKNCYAPAGTVCDQQTKTGCANGNACSSDVFTWPVQYTCSGTSANCGTSGTERTDLKTLKTNCGAAESCNSSSATCQPTLGCDITYCRSGLCWTKRNAPVGV